MPITDRPKTRSRFTQKRKRTRETKIFFFFVNKSVVFRPRRSGRPWLAAGGNQVSRRIGGGGGGGGGGRRGRGGRGGPPSNCHWGSVARLLAVPVRSVLPVFFQGEVKGARLVPGQGFCMRVRFEVSKKKKKKKNHQPNCFNPTFASCFLQRRCQLATLRRAGFVFTEEDFRQNIFFFLFLASIFAPNAGSYVSIGNYVGGQKKKNLEQKGIKCR